MHALHCHHGCQMDLASSLPNHVWRPPDLEAGEVEEADAIEDDPGEVEDDDTVT